MLLFQGKPASGTTPVRPRGKVPSSAPKVERKPVPEVATEPVEPAPKLVSVAEKALDDNFGAAKEPSPAQYDEVHTATCIIYTCIVCIFSYLQRLSYPHLLDYNSSPLQLLVPWLQF